MTTLIQKDTCTPIFIAALFTIAKTWKQAKCPSTDEGIKKMWYKYTMEYYLAIKKNEIMPFYSNMGGPRDYHTKSDRERQISYNITYMWNLKEVIQMKISTKQKQTHRYREQAYGWQGWRGVGEGRIGSLGLADANYYV